MAELWALLHFIMPTLFDSHDEFNEWFSKDIESHAENKTGIDESESLHLDISFASVMLNVKSLYIFCRTFIKIAYDFETLYATENKEGCRE